MTLEEFYEECKLMKDKFTWTRDKYSGIRGRSDIESRTYFFPVHIFCPLTALYYVKTGKVLCQDKYRQAACELNISSTDASYIANSADDCTKSGYFRKEIRTQLLTNLGLNK